jgi:hypothetical protein
MCTEHGRQAEEGRGRSQAKYHADTDSPQQPGSNLRRDANQPFRIAGQDGQASDGHDRGSPNEENTGGSLRELIESGERHKAEIEAQLSLWRSLLKKMEDSEN